MCVSVRGREGEGAHTWGLSEGSGVEGGGGWLLSKFPLPQECRRGLRRGKQSGGPSGEPDSASSLPGVLAEVAGSKALSMHNALEASFY